VRPGSRVGRQVGRQAGRHTKRNKTLHRRGSRNRVSVEPALEARRFAGIVDDGARCGPAGAKPRRGVEGGLYFLLYCIVNPSVPVFLMASVLGEGGGRKGMKISRK